MKPLISVIIVSYNTFKLTKKCVEQVYASKALKDSDLEVILVDNNSDDSTVEYFKKNQAQVTLIPNKTNLGFGAGNNQGAKVARGEYLLFLNTDAFLRPNTLSILLTELQKDDSILAVGPKYHYKDGSFQQSFGYFPSLSRLIGWMWWLDKLPLIKLAFAKPYHAFDPKHYEVSRRVDWLMGACILMRKADFDKVHGFDEQIFMYAEEVELFLRLSKSTHKSVLYTPATSITHLGSASTKQAMAMRLVRELEGIKYIYAHHFKSQLWLARFILYTGVIIRLFIFTYISKRPEAVLEYKKYLSNKS
jgi:GT2 family glycosyltransferase